MSKRQPRYPHCPPEAKPEDNTMGPFRPSRAALAAGQAGRRYQERHPGRDARADGLIGLAWAAIPYLMEYRWDLVPLAQAAEAGLEPAAPLPQLPTWVKDGHELLVMLAVGEPAPDPILEAVWSSWTEPLLVHQILGERPYHVWTAAFELVRALRAGVPRAQAVVPFKRALLDAPIAVEMDADAVDDEVAAKCQAAAESVTGSWARAVRSKRPAHHPKELHLRMFYLGVRGYYEHVGLGAPSHKDLADMALAVGFEFALAPTVEGWWRTRLRQWLDADGSIPAGFLGF